MIFYFISSRALQVLPINIDPIPKEITEQFGLLTLHDVSIFKFIIPYSISPYLPYEKLTILDLTTNSICTNLCSCRIRKPHGNRTIVTNLPLVLPK